MLKCKRQEFHVRALEIIENTSTLWEGRCLTRIVLGAGDLSCNNELCGSTSFPCLKLVKSLDSFRYERFKEPIVALYNQYSHSDILTKIWKGTLANALQETDNPSEARRLSICRFSFVLDALFKSLLIHV
jgi:hypothetical protein